MLKSVFPIVTIIVTIIIATPTTFGADLADITNFRSYSDTFASSGQPDAKQLKMIKRAGYQRVVYLAFTDNDSALSAEDRIVTELGMHYVHIPVDFKHPTKEDFELFASVMQTSPKAKTLLHCQVNFRASTFSFLYRVLYQNVPILTAKRDLDDVWQPNATWFRFIRNVLSAHDQTHLCDGCDWGELDFIE